MSSIPAKNTDQLDRLYVQPKESFLRRYGKRIAGGLACAAVVSVIMHLPYIKQAILWLCQIILLIFGRPAGFNHLPKRAEIEKKAGIIITKARGITHEKAAVVIPLAVPKAATKLKEEAHAVREAARGAEKLAHAGHDMTTAVKDTGTKMQKGMNSTSERIAKALHDRKEAKEKAHYDQLKVHARTIGVKVDESWSLARLDAEINAAEDARWHKRYNAQCPRCHRPTRITEAGTRELFACDSCHTMFSGRAARSLGAPPRQRPMSWW
jgi:hypothetical protein